MLNLDFDQLLKGIQLLLGVQLVFVFAAHFLKKSEWSKKLLAILALISGLWFFKQVFMGYWEQNLLLFLLIGPGKPIFAGSILFLYYKSLTEDLNRKTVALHMLAPAIYYFVLVVIRYFFRNNITDYSEPIISIGFSFLVLVIFWYYFFITKKELKKNVRHILIPKAYAKAFLLFSSLYFFLLQIPIWDIISNIRLIYDPIGSVWHFLFQLYDDFFVYAGYYASYTYLHFLGYFLFLYTLSELTFIKNTFTPKNILIHSHLSTQRKDIDEMFEDYFFKLKKFKEPDMNLRTCAADLQLSIRELNDYMKISQKGIFKEYVNKLRIEEVKKYMVLEQYAKYDLVGIGFICGFKSKSTFFRVFKNFEGITPKEYQNEKQTNLFS